MSLNIDPYHKQQPVDNHNYVPDIIWEGFWLPLHCLIGDVSVFIFVVSNGQAVKFLHCMDSFIKLITNQLKHFTQSIKVTDLVRDSVGVTLENKHFFLADKGEIQEIH